MRNKKEMCRFLKRLNFPPGCEMNNEMDFNLGFHEDIKFGCPEKEKKGKKKKIHLIFNILLYKEESDEKEGSV